MLTKIKVSTRMNAFNLLETKRHMELYISSRVGVMCQLFMVMKAVVLVAHTKSFVPS